MKYIIRLMLLVSITMNYSCKTDNSEIDMKMAYDTVYIDKDMYDLYLKKDDMKYFVRSYYKEQLFSFAVWKDSSKGVYTKLVFDTVDLSLKSVLSYEDFKLNGESYFYNDSFLKLIRTFKDDVQVSYEGFKDAEYDPVYYEFCTIPNVIFNPLSERWIVKPRIYKYYLGKNPGYKLQSFRYKVDDSDKFYEGEVINNDYVYLDLSMLSQGEHVIEEHIFNSTEIKKEPNKKIVRELETIGHINVVVE